MARPLDCSVFDPHHEAAVRLEARTTLRLPEPLHVLRVPVCGRDRSCPRDGVGVPIELLGLHDGCGIGHVFFTALVSRATDKRRPDALGVPNLLHVGTRRGFAHGKHVAAIAVKEGGHPVVRDAMDVNRDFF